MTARIDLARPLVAATLGAACLIAGALAGADPVVAIAGVLALAYAALALSNLALGLAAFCLFAFVEPGSLGKVLVAATVVLILAWVAHLASVRQEGAASASFATRHRAAAFALALLLAWAALSLSWTAEPSNGYLELYRYLLGAGVFLVAFTAMQTREGVVWVLGAYLLGATAISLVGPELRPDAFGLGPSGEVAEGRYTGGLQDPNEYAALLIPAIAIGIAAVAALQGRAGLRLAAGALLAIAVASFALTASRGGLIGLGAALIAGIVVAGRHRPAAIATALTLAAGALVYYQGLAPDHVRERLAVATKGEQSAREGRVTIWTVAWRMAKDRPLVGVGVGNFANASIPYALEPGVPFRTDELIERPAAAHNTYLHVQDELGLPGTGLLLGLIGFCVWACAAAARNFRRLGDVAMEVLARALVAGQVGMLVAAFFFSAQSVNKFWLVLAFGPALLAVSRSAIRGSQIPS